MTSAVSLRSRVMRKYQARFWRAVEGATSSLTLIFLDNDPIPVYGDNEAKLIKFSGKIIKRGLYRSSTGKSINSDVNASYNILRKVFPKAFADGIESCVVQPRLVTPTKEKIKGYNDSIFHEEPFYTTSYCEVTKFKTKKGSS